MGLWTTVDESLVKNKFMNIIQCMAERSCAETLILRLPPSKENCVEELEPLKSRCGKDELLIRELLVYLTFPGYHPEQQPTKIYLKRLIIRVLLYTS